MRHREEPLELDIEARCVFGQSNYPPIAHLGRATDEIPPIWIRLPDNEAASRDDFAKATRDLELHVVLAQMPQGGERREKFGKNMQHPAIDIMYTQWVPVWCDRYDLTVAGSCRCKFHGQQTK